jgi:hypothetical protein
MTPQLRMHADDTSDVVFHPHRLGVIPPFGGGRGPHLRASPLCVVDKWVVWDGVANTPDAQGREPER